MRIVLLISVVGKVKRGGESTTLGLVSYLDERCDLKVISGGDFNYKKTINVGFPEILSYESFYNKLPNIVKNRLLRRLHYDPLSVRNIIFCKRALYFIRSIAPDLIVFRSVGPWGAKLGRLIRRKSKIPFVTIEGGWMKGERETARFNPNLHISVNPDVADYLRKQLPVVNIVHLPNGLSLDDFRPDGAAAQSDLPGPLILGCGMLGDVKRFDLTIHAVHRLGGASLLLLGQGDQEETLSKMGKKLLKERFCIKAVPYEKMAAYYRSAKVVTVPSSGESFGMVYLEAMACNTPVVATRDRNREIIIGDGGKLIDPQDIEAYAGALKYCLDTGFAEKPRKQAEKFDWCTIGPRYLAEFKNVVEEAKTMRRASFPVFRRMG
jgi:glycosyltransferase involved in cell wall biosynthesis